jgi:hypothetical protein
MSILEGSRIKKDIRPLVANTGLGPGDTVALEKNPIDCQASAADIQALRSRGVHVRVDCP